MYLLFLIALGTANWVVGVVDPYSTKSECVTARQHAIEHIGKPVENYQLTCVYHNEKGI